MKADLEELIDHSEKKPEWLAFIRDASALAALKSFAHHQHKKILCLQPAELFLGLEWINAGFIPSFVFIELSDIELAYTELQSLIDSLPNSANIVVLGAENDIGRYRQLQKMGITEYLFFPITEELLLQACFKPGMKKIESIPKNNLLIPIIGVRGGVGATTFAINAAFTWSLLSQRVCLLDLDTQVGDIGLNLDIAERAGIQEALTESERIDVTFINNLLVEKKPNLFVISNDWSVTHPYSESQITEATLQHFFMLLYEKMDSVFIDLSSYLNKNLAKMLLPHARYCFLVTDLSLSATRDTVHLVQWIKMHFPDLQIKIIVNTSRPLLNVEPVQHALEQALGEKVATILPYCKEKMQQATLNGDIFSDRFNKSTYAKNLHLLLHELAQEQKILLSPKKSFWQRLREWR